LYLLTQWITTLKDEDTKSFVLSIYQLFIKKRASRLYVTGGLEQ